MIRQTQGAMSEWLGTGLQNRSQRFESAWHLKRGIRIRGFLFFYHKSWLLSSGRRKAADSRQAFASDKKRLTKIRPILWIRGWSGTTFCQSRNESAGKMLHNERALPEYINRAGRHFCHPSTVERIYLIRQGEVDSLPAKAARHILHTRDDRNPAGHRHPVKSDVFAIDIQAVIVQSPYKV